MLFTTATILSILSLAAAGLAAPIQLVARGTMTKTGDGAVCFVRVNVVAACSFVDTCYRYFLLPRDGGLRRRKQVDRLDRCCIPLGLRQLPVSVASYTSPGDDLTNYTEDIL